MPSLIRRRHTGLDPWPDAKARAEIIQTRGERQKRVVCLTIDWDHAYQDELRQPRDGRGYFQVEG